MAVILMYPVLLTSSSCIYMLQERERVSEREEQWRGEAEKGEL